MSTSDQADHGVSLEAQEHRIQAWCTTNGFALKDTKVDRGLSGGRADNRPALQEALALVGRGDALVVYSLSRLARSTRDTLLIAETLDRKGADLVSLSEKIDTTSATGKMVFRLLAVLAEFERDVIAERTSLAMRHLKAQNRYTGGRTPYGHCVEDGNLVPSPEEVSVVREALLLRLQGLSLRRIADTLEGQGRMSRSGAPFRAIQIARMFRYGSL